MRAEWKMDHCALDLAVAALGSIVFVAGAAGLALAMMHQSVIVAVASLAAMREPYLAELLNAYSALHWYFVDSRRGSTRFAPGDVVKIARSNGAALEVARIIRRPLTTRVGDLRKSQRCFGPNLDAWTVRLAASGECVVVLEEEIRQLSPLEQFAVQADDTLRHRLSKGLRSKHI